MQTCIIGDDIGLKRSQISSHLLNENALLAKLEKKFNGHLYQLVLNNILNKGLTKALF